MEADFDAIRRDLDRLRSARSPVFGAQGHRFELNPPLTEEAVREFEAAYDGLVLPADYRGFLLRVGNGGAGPGYGLFPLGERGDAARDTTPWGIVDSFVGDLAEPFPHTAAWNDLTGMPPPWDEDEDPDGEDEHQRQMNLFEERYFDRKNVNGAVPLCHLGCASYQWLVVTGPEAGHVWDDARVDRGGLFPVRRAGRDRVTFLQWYRYWLDEAVGRLR